jgi:hypothetical protein
LINDYDETRIMNFVAVHIAIEFRPTYNCDLFVCNSVYYSSVKTVSEHLINGLKFPRAFLIFIVRLLRKLF